LTDVAGSSAIASSSRAVAHRCVCLRTKELQKLAEAVLVEGEACGSNLGLLGRQPIYDPGPSRHARDLLAGHFLVKTLDDFLRL
jgi:hypothetical protein